MKSFKNDNEITFPFGLAFAQVVIIKLFDLGFLPRLLSFQPGRRELQLLVAPGLYLPQPKPCLSNAAWRDAKVWRFGGLAEPC